MESEPEPVSCVLSQNCTTCSIFYTVPVNFYFTNNLSPWPEFKKKGLVEKFKWKNSSEFNSEIRSR